MPAQMQYPRELIQGALREHARLALRSEKHKHYLDLFVDAGHLDVLMNPDWQVIFGRRGAGKTFLFGALKEEYDRKLLDRRILCVPVTAQDCILSALGRDISDKVRATAYFQAFIEALADQLANAVDRLLGEPSFWEAITGQRRRTHDRVEELALQILQLSQMGIPVSALASARQTQEVRTESAESDSSGVSTRLTWNVRSGVQAELAADASRAESRKTTRLESASYETGLVPRYALVRRALLELAELMDIAQVNILIDEWPVLDPTAGPIIQPEFAELLKRTFAGTDRISIKVAANRYLTSFSNRGTGRNYRGLELNADIFEALNLDRVILGPKDLMNFYRRLLFKRLQYVEPRLGTYDPQSVGDPAPGFLHSIFASETAFAEVVRGSEGIPREFIIIINDLSRYHDYSVDPRWTTADVRRVIQDKSVSGTYDIEYRSPADELLTVLRERSALADSRVFFIRHRDRPRMLAAVEELLEKRLIHELPRAEVPASLRPSVDGYLLDYGLWLDLERSRIRQVAVEPGIAVSPANAERLIVDPPQTIAKTIRCQYCESIFTEEEHSYQVRRLCPKCFLEAGVESPD